MAKISVLGSGGWGMALAMNAVECGHEVILWSPFEEEVSALSETRTNDRLLSGIVLPDKIFITSDLKYVEGSAITIIATPSTAVRSVVEKLVGYSDFGIVVNVAKGVEKGSLKRLSEVIGEVIGDSKVVVLSGPSHAEEVARRIPTSLVAASNSKASAEIVQYLLSNDYFRIYTSTDVVGVELGGAIKNVIAICAGMCDGLGLGDNSKAALITRGLAEMSRLGVSMGADETTFAGLAGIGDLVVTCTSRHSRNNRFGFKVGSGIDVETALREVGTVEGYYAALMTHELALKHRIEMPIVTECYNVLYCGADIRCAVNNLMMRPKRSER